MAGGVTRGAGAVDRTKSTSESMEEYRTPEQHREGWGCSAGGEIPEQYREGYPRAVNQCRLDDEGRLWVSNQEYRNTVAFCPFCGFQAPEISE